LWLRDEYLFVLFDGRVLAILHDIEELGLDADWDDDIGSWNRI